MKGAHARVPTELKEFFTKQNSDDLNSKTEIFFAFLFLRGRFPRWQEPPQFVAVPPPVRAPQEEARRSTRAVFVCILSVALLPSRCPFFFPLKRYDTVPLGIVPLHIKYIPER